MKEQSYALIRNGVVQQLLTTDQDIASMFAPGLQWVQVADPGSVSPGDLYNGTSFTAPAPLAAPAGGMTLAALQAELATLQRAVAALSPAP